MRLLQILLTVGLVAASGSYAYRIGVSATEVRADKLAAELERVEAAHRELQDRLSSAARARAGSELELERLRARYAREVPDGPAAALLERIEAMLESGVEPARLALMMEAAGRPPACEDEPETKRFVVRTPLSDDASSAVRFGGGRIVVTGEGEPALDEAGRREAWYDPAREVRLTFRHLDGSSETVAGTLPLQHRLLVDGREYRFSAIAGERAFLEVTAQACRIPADTEADGSASG